MLSPQALDLTPLNTLHLSSSTNAYLALSSCEQLPKLAELIHNYPKFFILGGGSNIILPTHYTGLLIHNQLSGINVEQHDADHIYITAKAGENWDKFVAWCLQHGAYGLENLSLIPGTVGAAPVQNIGAYGVEVKDFIEFVDVYDLSTQQFLRLTNAECQFSYRNSLFKSKANYLIWQVGFKLYRQAKLKLNYADVSQRLSNKPQPSALDLRQCIIEIRQAKLPDPALIGNAGSFFHNPIIARAHYMQLQAKHPNLPSYPTADPDLVKVPAGWLIDQLGLKGYREGNLGVYAKQALVLVNYAASNQEELLQFAHKIQAQVQAAYQINLNIEPIIIW